MRRIIGVAVVMAAMAAVPSAASAKGDGSQLPKKLTVWTQSVQDSFLDLGSPGFTVGDKDVFSDDLSRTRGGDVIGSDGGECTVVRVDEVFYGFAFQCLVTFSLPRGQITTQGLIEYTNGEPEDPATLAITGGTRRYKRARGQVKVRFLSETEAKIVFRLST
jgi:hypothetical protein